MPRDLPANLVPATVPPSLSHHAISLQSWSGRNPKYYGLITGALIFRRLPSQPTQILLLLRAATDSYPNVWEPPGGSVDLDDKTLLEGLVREVWEETGLRVKGFMGQVWDKEFVEGDEVVEVTFLGKRGERWCKLNFLVEVVDGDEVELDPLEHQDFGWFEEGQVRELPFVSEQGRNIVLNGFRSAKRL